MRIISGKFRNHTLYTPKGDNTRPTSGKLREAVFNMCQADIVDAAFLDLFAGSGAMGFEALSRGAASATFIEIAPIAIRSLQKNIKTLNLQEESALIKEKLPHALTLLEQQKKQYDLIYIDPPYQLQVKWRGKTDLIANHILRLLDTSSILSPNSKIFIEESSETQFDLLSLKNLTLQKSKSYGKTTLSIFTGILNEA